MDQIEIEAKFIVENPKQVSRFQELLIAQNLDIKSTHIIDQVDHYLDTPDWEIYKAGWACR